MATRTVARVCGIVMLILAVTSIASESSEPVTASAGFTHGIFDDANVHTPASFGVMIDDVKPRGFTAIMLSNGNLDHNSALLAVSDQKGMDVYLGATEEALQTWCCWDTIEGARPLAAEMKRRLGPHPSFRGYYLYDEPDTDYDSMASLLAQALKEIDPGRSRFVVSGSIDGRLNVYDPTQMAPFVLDAYPFSAGTPHCDIVSPQGRFAGFNYPDFIQQALSRSAKPAATPFWMIGQTHGSSALGLRAPNAEEIRAQYRVAVNSGATGMIWFAYTSQQGWTGLKNAPARMAAVQAIAQGTSTGAACGVSVTSTPTATPTPTSTSTATPTATATATRTPTPGTLGNGVSSVSLNYAEDVDQFWARHPANSSAIGYVPNLGTAGPVIDVPTGANLQTVVDTQCPMTGCTLLLSGGTYAAVHLIGRSHIHFRGKSRSGARLRSVTVAGCAQEIDAGGGGTGSYTAMNEALANNDASAWACFTNRGGDVSFKNLTFDGGGNAGVWNDVDHRVNGAALWIRTQVGVWVEDVDVTGYADGGSVHDGAIGGNIRIDNVVLRRIHFDTFTDRGPSTYAFFDGCHGCAILDSDTGFSRAGTFTFFVNDDFTEDINHDGLWSQDELRLANYIVLRGNTFRGENQSAAMAVQGAHALIEHNTSLFWSTDFALFQTRQPFNHPAGTYAYHHVGHRVRGNTINAASAFTRFDAPDVCDPPVTGDQCWYAGDIAVTDNTMVFGDRSWAELLWTSGNVWPSQYVPWPTGYPQHAPITMARNTVQNP